MEPRLFGGVFSSRPFEIVSSILHIEGKFRRLGPATCEGPTGPLQTPMKKGERYEKTTNRTEIQGLP